MSKTQWQRGNDAGEGYAVGSDGHTPEQACEAEGWQILHRRAADDDVCLARKPDGTLVTVGAASGPWAVDLGAPTCEVAQ